MANLTLQCGKIEFDDGRFAYFLDGSSEILRTIEDLVESIWSKHKETFLDQSAGITICPVSREITRAVGDKALLLHRIVDLDPNSEESRLWILVNNKIRKATE